MPKEIEVPGIGTVEFPDGMTDDQIVSAIKNNMSGGDSRGTNQGFSDQLMNAAKQLGQGVEQIPSNILSMMQGAGRQMVNFPAQAINTILPDKYKFSLFPEQDQSIPYKAGEALGDIGTYLGSGSAVNSARNAAEALPALGRAAKWLGSSSPIASPISSIAGTSAYGAIQNPENRGQGALYGALGGAAGETIPTALKTLGAAAEYANPIKYANQLSKSIKEAYNVSKQKASSFFEPVTKAYGDTFITTPGVVSSYKSLDKDLIKDNYDYGLKKMHQDFMDKPTFQKAHDLQSQLGVEIRSLQSASPDAMTRRTISGLTEARNALKADMQGYLQGKDPQMANMYNIGAQIFANEVAPFRANKTISQLAAGSQKTITPRKLINELTKVTQSGAAPQQHFLSQALADISSKVNKGKAAADILPLVMGGLAGGGGLLAGEGVLPGAGGAALGAITGKFITPSLFRLSQNPTLQKTIKNLEPGYKNLVRAIIAPSLGNR